MVSHFHKCIFVHIPKCAGISVEQIFIDDLNLNFDNRMPLLLGVNQNRDLGPPRISHLTAREYVDLYFISKDLFQAYYKFTVVRNPYNRVFSFYKYFCFDLLISFKKFVEEYLELFFNSKDHGYFMAPMKSYLLDANNKIIVDDILKLESLEEDIQKIKGNISLNSFLLRNLNDSKESSVATKMLRVFRIVKIFPGVLFQFSFRRSDKNKLFDAEMKDIVFKLYKDDFHAFGYKR